MCNCEVFVPDPPLLCFRFSARRDIISMDITLSQNNYAKVICKFVMNSVLSREVLCVKKSCVRWLAKTATLHLH
jgi:hypothetical protein